MRLFKVLGALAGLVLFGIVSGYGRYKIALLVCLCRILNLRSLQAIVPISLAYIFLNPPFSGIVNTHWPDVQLILRARYGENDLGDPAVKYFGLVARLLVGYGLFRLLCRYSLRQKMILLHLATFALILSSGMYLHSGPVTAAVGLYFLTTFCWHVPVLAYLLLDHTGLTPGQFLRLYLVPFWETSPNPQPILDLPPEEDREDELLDRSLVLALQFSAVIVCSNLVQAVLYDTTFYGRDLPVPFAPLPNIGVIGITNSVFLVYPRWQVWIAVLWSGLHRVTGYFALGVFIECCRLTLGYRVPRRFVFPWGINSFGEFYSCIMPYYVVAVNRVYLHPIYTYLRLKGWGRKWGFELATLLAIFLANLSIHVVKDVQLVGVVGGSEYLFRSILTEIPYCIVLFTFLRFLGVPGRLSKSTPAPVKFLFLLVLYSTAMIFRTGGIWVDLESRLRFVGALYLGIGL